jgi:TetR/AcrR family transcriptional regulator, transcriptional repressor for nem operon
MKQRSSAPRTPGRPVTRRLTERAARKRETHQRILQSAVNLARRQGLAAASVPRVMRGAGLTVGGFYAHFDSKTAMDAELIRTMFGSLPGPWLDGLDDFSGLEWLARAVKRYLSVAHRETSDGCGYPAVISEVSRAGAEVRAAFAEAVELRVRILGAHSPEVPGITARERAIATLALVVGGLLLARATRGAGISDEMLNACRKWALPEADAASDAARTRPTTAANKRNLRRGR